MCSLQLILYCFLFCFVFFYLFLFVVFCFVFDSVGNYQCWKFFSHDKEFFIFGLLLVGIVVVVAFEL